MIAQRLLWLWLHPYSTQVIHGVQAGGQVHIAFGHSATEIATFFAQSEIQRVGPEWRFRLERFGQYRARSIRFYENPPGTQRAGECRIPAQTPTSPERYFLWQDVVEQLASGQRPRQCILFLRDEDNHFHTRVLSRDEIVSQMPDRLATTLQSTRLVSKAGVWVGGLVYEDSGVVTYPETETVDAARRSTRERRRKKLDTFEEGFVSEILVELTHRNAEFARSVKERDGYTCVVCGFNFFDTYGDRGQGFAECHHLISFTVLRGRRASTLDEAVTVCSNCHRMLHRGSEILTPAELQQMLRG